MKVLHISNIFNLSGWSKQAEMHALALDSAGVDLAVRHVDILQNRNPDVHPRVLELAKKDCQNPDVVIYNTLPNMYERTSRARNVGYYVVETTNFREAGWSNYINLMDRALVPSFSCKQASLDSGVRTPISIVPECVDTGKYSKTYETHPIRRMHGDKFLFLVVAEFTRRKNIESIIKAFHLEFTPTEPVELVIKTTPVGMVDPQREINDKLETIKRGLKLYNNTDRYKKENVICGFLSEADMCSLHSSVDCLVNASRAEAFCIPVVDSLGFGVPVVSPNHSGLDYLSEKNAFLVRSYESPCFGAVDTLPELYSGRENWYETDVLSLRSQMRSCYEKQSLRLKKVQSGRETVKKFYLETVGKIYREALEKIL